MKIGGLQKLTLIDYPGKVAATVFFIGCNFKCPYCQNPELVDPEKIQNQLKILEKDFFKFLDSRRDFLEGVCITGGEPTTHKELFDFIKKIKQKGFLVKLDTNGSNPEILKKLIDTKLLDFMAMDIKAPKEKYSQTVGIKVDIKKIQKSIDILKKGKVDYEFRSTILPKVHTKKDVVNMAQWIRNAKIYYLQQFRSEKTLDPEYKKCEPFSQRELELIQRECNKYIITKLRS